MREIVWDYLKNHSCVDCGESDILVLQFDHRDPRTKRFNLSNASSRYSLEEVMEEIAKCDVVCANCHCRRTARMFNWKKLHWAG